MKLYLHHQSCPLFFPEGLPLRYNLRLLLLKQRKELKYPLNKYTVI